MVQAELKLRMQIQRISAIHNRTTGRDNGGVWAVLLGEKTSTENDGGEGGIRTPGTLLTYTRFPSVLDKPL